MGELWALAKGECKFLRLLREGRSRKAKTVWDQLSVDQFSVIQFEDDGNYMQILPFAADDKKKAKE